MADSDKTPKTQGDFEEYRRNMHRDDNEKRAEMTTPKKAIGIAFGLFMIVIYVGVGILLIMNFFNWDSSFTWVRWLIGIVLIIYGIFRGYRQYVGAGSYGN